MVEAFWKGGPVMWPLLALSLVTLTVAIERLVFLVRERWRRRPEAVLAVLGAAECGDLEGAVRAGLGSTDSVARSLARALEHGEGSFASAMPRVASAELRRFERGVAVLDTAITLAPLLGLFGTVTGMIRAFGLLGGRELDAPAAITGGIAEALLATAFGLAIAILAVVPFNLLNARLEEERRDLEDAASQVERALGPGRPPDGRPGPRGAP